jgi:hypothetical protein
MLLDLDPVQSGHSINVRSFSGLMDLYEQNYMRLRKIAPDLNVADQMISSVAGHTDLYLSVRERCKYTTMLSMTYRFGEPGDYVFEPDLHLRVYHDARVVEVDLFPRRKHGWVFNDYSLQHKWVMNRFLYKWFGFCVHQGHFFQPMTHLKY